MSAPPAQRPPLLVVAVDDDAAPLADADLLLDRAARRARTDVALPSSDVDTLLRRALGYDGPAPRLDRDRRAALEATGSEAGTGWRLVALGAVDPTHGLDADEGIGPPSGEAQRG